MTKIATSKAFGLVETLIASAIIIVVVFALTAVSSITLAGTRRTQEHAQAMNLAQEGIEVARQIRDTNWIDSDRTTSWNKLVATNQSAPVWTIPALNSGYSVSFIDSGSPQISRLFLSTAGIGGVAGAGQKITLDGSDFVRKIKSETVGELLPGVDCSGSTPNDKSVCAIKITSTVKTPSGADVSVSEVLTNWRPNF